MGWRSRETKLAIFTILAGSQFAGYSQRLDNKNGVVTNITCALPSKTLSCRQSLGVGDKTYPYIAKNILPRISPVT
jgi:hypothetical protein